MASFLPSLTTAGKEEACDVGRQCDGLGQLGHGAQLAGRKGGVRAEKGGADRREVEVGGGGGQERSFRGGGN